MFRQHPLAACPSVTPVQGVASALMHLSGPLSATSPGPGGGSDAAETHRRSRNPLVTLSQADSCFPSLGGQQLRLLPCLLRKGGEQQEIKLILALCEAARLWLEGNERVEIKKKKKGTLSPRSRAGTGCRTVKRGLDWRRIATSLACPAEETKAFPILAPASHPEPQDLPGSLRCLLCKTRMDDVGVFYPGLVSFLLFKAA